MCVVVSYEGYTQNICERGHRFDAPCEWGGDPANRSTCHCGAHAAWTNSVDVTNCDEYGIILPGDFRQLLIEDDLVVVCNLGHPHIVRHATYNVPCEGGPAVPRRHYWDYVEQIYVELPAR
mgnify:CR=1 FL=1